MEEKICTECMGDGYIDTPDNTCTKCLGEGTQRAANEAIE